MPRPTFTNDYAADGRDLRASSRQDAGNRCIRCGHPYECGLKREDRGEWSACDEKCVHLGPIRLKAPGDLAWVTVTKNQNVLIPIGQWVQSGGLCEANWRILTVHHFDGDKANDAWWNHLPLCQKCHLQFQNKVDPNVPYFFEHSPWLKPYVAGFYAKKYEGKLLTREEVTARLDELLAWECKIPCDARATHILAADVRHGLCEPPQRPEARADAGADHRVTQPDLPDL
jgi:hypothetical protein